MRRYLFAAFAAASLVVCVMIVIVFVRQRGLTVFVYGTNGWRHYESHYLAPGIRVTELHIFASPQLRYQIGWPLLVLGFIAALPPGALILRVHRDGLGPRRIRNGDCGNCGYSLHGNQSGICPECGSDANPTHANKI